MSTEFNSSNIAEMNPITLYGVLKLRTDVFVVEQNCPYPELDGRDLEPDCELVWATVNGELAGTTRILHDDDALRIGRVVASPNHRGTGIARELFAYTLDLCKQLDPNAKVVLDAQAPLQNWYGSFGFTPVSDVFLEDGLPHITMEL